MKNGAALSVVLAPGGTAMFWVTQAVCAKACGMSDTVDINVPARTTDPFFILVSIQLARLTGSSSPEVC